MQFHFETPKRQTIDTTKLWDFIVIGGGPAGYNASLYAKRKGLDVLLVALEFGGQLKNTSAVDNYLGLQLISGDDLNQQFLDHIKTLDVDILSNRRVIGLKKIGDQFELLLDNSQTLTTRTVLLSTGGLPRKLDVPGENMFAGAGISYCAICDAPFFKDLNVIIAGGGNSAVEAAIDVSKWANHITLIQRSQLRADQILIDKLESTHNVTIHLETQILEVIGSKRLEGVLVLDKKTQEKRMVEANGIFIEIGTIPNSVLVQDLVVLNDHNEVIVDHNQMTSLPGLFAAGDVTMQPFKQIIIAAAEGAKAALAASQYINNQSKEK